MKDGLIMSDSLSMEFIKGKIREEILLSSNMKLELFDENGVLKILREVHNTVTLAGKYGTMDLLLAIPTFAKPNWMAVGNGIPSGTLLGGEIARVVLDSKTRNNNGVTFICTFPAGTGTGTLIEAGLFDIATANTINMWLSGTFASIPKTGADSLVITWTLTQN